MRPLLFAIASALIFPLFASNSFAADERDLVCYSGPGMFARYSQTRLHQLMIVRFRKQNVSHANKKVSPGYCAFPLAGMGPQWSDTLYFSKENPRDTVVVLQISPETTRVDLSDKDNYGLIPKAKSSLDPRIMAMMEMMHNHRWYVIRAVHKKVQGFGWVWAVKSIGWNNTL